MKKVQVIWTDELLGDLETMYDFLAENPPKAAKKGAMSNLAKVEQVWAVISREA